MHDFKYRNNELYCESVRIEDVALKFSTPLYIYSHKTLIGRYLKLKRAFASIDPLICFSVKSSSNLSLLKALADKGAGLDIVSGGELYRAQKIKANPKTIVYASVGKTREEIEAAIRYGILFFNVESLQELGLISEAASVLKKDVRVCVRINPNVDPHTHRYITTGTMETKFGVDFDTARIIFLNKENFKRVHILGLHVHIGSQITQVAPFLAALRRVIDLINALKKMGIRLEWLNIGGGLGIIYKEENPQTAEQFASRIVPLLKKTGLKIILEPGRFIVGPAGILVTRVIYVKDSSLKRFVVVDAGMNDLIRPSLYGAYHEILPVKRTEYGRRNTEYGKKSDVVGPICESGDFLAKDRDLPILAPGTFLACMGAGAYGFSMSSNYNSRRKAAEVLVSGKKFYLIREREKLSDLVRHEKVVKL
ncbi:MAG: diaminopimelate decarboxylase [Candidatus Omnitrophica bacterium CG1_02_44_16]|nr:MAG: diaminopimelate decarboxylase [Candidatus Omnitrophica bacterium CG1_02_44_16]PIY82071.1 MAG: diaminopimelate decarboxylase [Candidatus Omnitrophica bacterium CG_4_10_14_0_8_um_filter_44_12]PIZ84804.1 MAG: diaminopimelate decarboxylase [Candidatus Omnitrophica bacterium CG_4_10_14_0_2_um_filter_44_9]